MSASDLKDAHWRRSRYSGAQGNCVEMAAVTAGEQGGVALRNSRFPDAPALVLSPDDVAGLLSDVRAGHFDGGADRR